MDTTSSVTHVSLCAGYGGIDIGLKRAVPTLRTIAFSEIEAFACANLVAKMEAGLLDPAPVWTDLKTFPWCEFRDRVDILSGGYPCQPFSAAGKRLGQEDPRHLWPHISAGIAAMRPRCCFFENVEGHISLGLPDVIEDLGRLGYRTTWGIFSASEVGAPHQRKRVFVLAHRNGDRFISDVARAATLAHSDRTQDGVSGADGELAYRQCQGLEGFNYRHSPAEQAEHVGADAWASGERGSWDIWPSRPGEQQHGWEPPRVVGNASNRSNRQQQTEQQGRDSAGGSGEEGAMGNAQSERPAARRPQHERLGGELCSARTSGAGAMGHPNSPRPQVGPRQRGSAIQGADADGGEAAGGQTQPPLGRDLDGPAGRLGYAELCVSCDNRTDELRLLGNGVVPATAERAFRTLAGELMEANQ